MPPRPFYVVREVGEPPEPPKLMKARCHVCQTNRALLKSGVLVAHKPYGRGTKRCLGSHRIPEEIKDPSLEAVLADAKGRIWAAEEETRRLRDVLRRLSEIPVLTGGFISAEKFGKIMIEVEEYLE